MEDGFESCPKCKGKKELVVYFEYKGKKFHYYSKCGHCYATGKVDWIKKVMGRKPGITGMFFDNHSAGSVQIDGTEDEVMGGTKIYDGHEYISVETKRGKALWHKLVQRRGD